MRYRVWNGLIPTSGSMWIRFSADGRLIFARGGAACSIWEPATDWPDAWCLISAMAAYPLAKMRFRGREWLFYALLATLIVP